MGSTLLSLAAVLVLVLLNGYFVAIEFALVGVRRTRIEQLAQEGSARARSVLRALPHLDLYIAGAQVGITLASLALGYLAEPAVSALLEPVLSPVLPPSGVFSLHTVSLVLSFATATVLHIVLGEQVPKTIAIQRAEATAMWLTGPTTLFIKIFRPAVWFIGALTNLTLKALRLPSTGHHHAVHSVEELELLVRSTREAGLLHEQQERMVAGVFEFPDRQASQVMTPRTEIEAIPLSVSLEELERRAGESAHSRLPIYDGDLDHIVGVVHVKDVLRAAVLRDADRSAPFDLRATMRKVLFVPETLPLDRLMAELRRHKLHLAVVTDEFGGTSGLVTFEDLLEEIVGDVADEFDTVDESVEERPDGSVVLDGLLSVDEVNERFGLGIEEPYYDSIGGHVFGWLQRAAEPGDVLALPDGRRLEVLEVRNRRIARLLLLPAPAPGASDAADGSSGSAMG